MRTTTMQLAHLIHEVEHNRNHYFQVSLPKKSGIGNQLHYRPHRTLLVLVDSSKAFDSIDHRVLSRLLANIPGVNCRRWLRNFLCGRYAKTRVGHRNSDRRPMLRGVPQGSVLGPYLFSLYVHPLLNLLNSFAGVTAAAAHETTRSKRGEVVWEATLPLSLSLSVVFVIIFTASVSTAFSFVLPCSLSFSFPSPLPAALNSGAFFGIPSLIGVLLTAECGCGPCGVGGLTGSPGMVA
ncbi:hypothetical protein C4B63_88g61 [Trypanosoma cruzi]|uniref:Reverse transcriptase domain-containing protein n=1 Tax=Trypanosoma cruzi TaxID=5693 RepID=A0A2V2UWT5_TRYCR|nr:hypothetical protein C4B63_88g61 [Trypanosoma cruzi]